MKPTKEQLDAMIADGRAVEFSHAVRCARLEDGNAVFLTDDGEILDTFVVVYDRGGVTVSERLRKPLEKVAAKIRQGGAGILSLLDSPLAILLEGLTGRSLGRLRGVASALAHRGVGAQAIALAQEVGSERARAVADFLELAASDGVVSLEEIERAVELAKGDG